MRDDLFLCSNHYRNNKRFCFLFLDLQRVSKETLRSDFVIGKYHQLGRSKCLVVEISHGYGETFTLIKDNLDNLEDVGIGQDFPWSIKNSLLKH